VLRAASRGVCAEAARQQHRLDELRQELRTRLEHICRDMSGDDFRTLVDDMARFRLKYEELDEELSGPSGARRRPDA
jgi:hypothetical protein